MIVPKNISLQRFLESKIEFLIEMEYRPTPRIWTFVSDLQEPDSHYFSNWNMFKLILLISLLNVFMAV